MESVYAAHVDRACMLRTQNICLQWGPIGRHDENRRCARVEVEIGLGRESAFVRTEIRELEVSSIWRAQVERNCRVWSWSWSW